MMRTYSLHFRLFNRLPFNEVDGGRKILQSLIESGGDWIPTKYGPREPVSNPFDPSDIAAASQLLGPKAYDLILVRRKPSWLAYFYWLPARTRPWFWTFDFGKDWLHPDGISSIDAVMTDFCTSYPILYAAGALVSDWADKHDVIDPLTGASRLTAGKNFDPGEGLPGVYWYTYFGKELVDHFEKDHIVDLCDVRTRVYSNGGIRLLCYKRPDYENPIWRRGREAEIVDALGSNYFFDLQKAAGRRPRRRAPIEGVTDAKSLRG